MARIPWLVKPANTIVVSKSPGYSYNTVQGAIDAISGFGDAAYNNRYVIVVMGPDIYEEQVHHYVPHVDIVGFGMPTIARLSDDPGTNSDNGTFIIGDAAAAVEVTDIHVEGIRIVRDVSGLTKDGYPPEAAVYIGVENTYPTSRHWDRISFSGCIIEGVHDGIQMFGMDYTATDVPGLLELRNCLIRSVHDAVTVKGAMRVDSAHNTIEVNAAGRSPWLTDIGDWKSTAFHINQNRGADTGNSTASNWASGDGNRYLRSTADSIRMLCSGNVVGSIAEEIFAAYLSYDQAGFTVITNPSVVIPHAYYVNSPNIHMVYDANEAPSEGIAAFRNYMQDIGCASGRFVVNGANVVLEQRNAGASAPDNVYGVMVDGGGDGSTIRITNSNFQLSNAKGSSNAYWATVGTGDTIEHGSVYANTNVDAGAAGTMTQLTEK